MIIIMMMMRVVKMAIAAVNSMRLGVIMIMIMMTAPTTITIRTGAK